MSYITNGCDSWFEQTQSNSYDFPSLIKRQQMDLRLIALMGRYQEKELEAIERWFDHTQPLALDMIGSMKIARGAIKRGQNF